MTDDAAAEFIARLAMLAEVMDTTLTPIRIAGYRAALDDLNPDDLVVALNEATKFCKFFPKPAEIRDYALDAQRIRERRDALAHPYVPSYRRLAPGDTPVPLARIDAELAKLRALVRTIPPLDDAPARRRR